MTSPLWFQFLQDIVGALLFDQWPIAWNISTIFCWYNCHALVTISKWLNNQNGFHVCRDFVRCQTELDWWTLFHEHRLTKPQFLSQLNCVVNIWCVMLNHIYNIFHEICTHFRFASFCWDCINFYIYRTVLFSIKNNLIYQCIFNLSSLW